MHDPDDEQVGYGRPPKHHQFKKGQSGNPKGRPRRALSVPEIVARVRDEMIPMTINGKRKRVTIVEAALRQNIMHALKGTNPRHLERLLATLEKYGVTPRHVMAEESRRNAEIVVKKLFSYVDANFSNRSVAADRDDDAPDGLDRPKGG